MHHHTKKAGNYITLNIIFRDNFYNMMLKKQDKR